MNRARLAGLAGLLVLLSLLAWAANFVGLLPGVKGPYHNSDLDLATAYRAKDACSCLFVQERDEAYCRAWTKASPDVASMAVDRDAKAVTSRALLFWSARARWVSPREGCVQE